MKKIYAILLFATLLSACSLGGLSKAQKEAIEAVQNLNNEAIEVYGNVETKVNQFQDAAESVKLASDAIGQANQDLKELTGKAEEE